MQVKCKKKYIVTDYDSGKEIKVSAGTIWKVIKDEYRRIGGEIRLENDDEDWLELPRKEFNEYFELMEVNKMELEREDILKMFLEWRNIETPCEKCGGSGVALYSNTSTFMYGIGGSSMRTDICDKCWGTGDKNKKGVNLRKYSHLFLRKEENK